MFVGVRVAVWVGVVGSKVALGVGLGMNGGEGTSGVEEITGVGVSLPVQALKTRLARISQPNKVLILILALIFQLHLPDGFQQRPALLKAGFTQVTQAKVDTAAAATQESSHQVCQGLLIGS